MQWLPYRWYYQIIFILYRWVVAGFFFAWLVASGFSSDNGGPRYFIFLTNWSFLAFNAHLVWAAVVSTVDFFREFVCCRRQYEDLGETRSLAYQRDLETPTGCCSKGHNKISWYHMIQWVLFLIGVELAVVVTILYWPLFYPHGSRITGVDFNTHGTQGIIAVIELLFSGVPIRFYHFYYTQIFGAVYAIFSGIYFAADGTNVRGDPFIYDVLDYGGSPGLATGLVLVVILVMLPAVHAVFYLVYVARYWMLFLIYRKCTSTTSSDHAQLEEVEKGADSPEGGSELKEVS